MTPRVILTERLEIGPRAIGGDPQMKVPRLRWGGRRLPITGPRPSSTADWQLKIVPRPPRIAKMRGSRRGRATWQPSYVTAMLNPAMTLPLSSIGSQGIAPRATAVAPQTKAHRLTRAAPVLPIAANEPSTTERLRLTTARRRRETARIPTLTSRRLCAAGRPGWRRGIVMSRPGYVIERPKRVTTRPVIATGRQGIAPRAIASGRLMKALGRTQVARRPPTAACEPSTTEEWQPKIAPRPQKTAKIPGPTS
jgi:hypothetical protein